MKPGERVLNRTPQTIEAAKTEHERKLKAAFESLQGGSRDPDGGTRLGVSSRTPGRFCLIRDAASRERVGAK